MLNRNIGLARPPPEDSADVPAAREIRVERQGTVDQRNHRADVLAEIGQRLGSIDEDAGIVARRLQAPPCKINRLSTIRLRIFAPTLKINPKTAGCGQSERGSVTRIARDRSLQQT